MIRELFIVRFFILSPPSNFPYLFFLFFLRNTIILAYYYYLSFFLVLHLCFLAIFFFFFYGSRSFIRSNGSIDIDIV